MNLFKEIVSKNKQHIYFSEVAKDDEIKEILNRWASDFEDRDGDFINKFQSTFNSCFWELYCFQIFKKLGFEIDLTKNSPDFVLKYGNINFNVECTISNNDKDFKPEFDMDEKLEPSYELKERVEYQTVRLLNSINSKQKKFNETYKNFEFIKGNPFILALAPFEQARFMDNGTSGILKVLYGLSVNEELSESYNNKIIKRKKEKEIELQGGIFTNENYSEVSGILFSSLATIGKLRTLTKKNIVISMERRFNSNTQMEDIYINYFPNKKIVENFLGKGVLENLLFENERSGLDTYEVEGISESLEDGLSLYINPYANISINKEIIDKLKESKIAIHSYNKEKRIYEQIFVPDGFLIQRAIFKFE